MNQSVANKCIRQLPTFNDIETDEVLFLGYRNGG